jgi:hypothetical protein
MANPFQNESTQDSEERRGNSPSSRYSVACNTEETRQDPVVRGPRNPTHNRMLRGELLLGRLQIAEPDRHQFGHPRLFHRDTKEGIGDAHRPFIVRNDEELSVLGQLP